MLWLLVVACCAKPRTCPPVERVIVRVQSVPCLQQKPPARVEGSDAQLAQAYVELERFVRMYVVPACGE